MALLAFALIIDWWIGDPDWLWRRIKHPVAWFGVVIDWFDTWQERLGGNAVRLTVGLGLLLVLFGLSLLVSWAVWQLSGVDFWLSKVVELAVVVIFLAQKSLRNHVLAVASALTDSGVEKGRVAVSMIVGRDVSKLDESGVSKASIESLAENFSDGVVAPAFWYAIGGLPWLIFYKAVNTADSMIGHRTEQHEYFGKPAARLDDLMNWLPARLSFVMVLVFSLFFKGFRAAGKVLKTTWNDAPGHRSPNAGWSETAFAAFLDLQLGGSRNYGEDIVDGAVLNVDGRETAAVDDIGRALDLFRGLCLLLLAIVFIIFMISR